MCFGSLHSSSLLMLILYVSPIVSAFHNSLFLKQILIAFYNLIDQNV